MIQMIATSSFFPIDAIGRSEYHFAPSDFPDGLRETGQMTHSL
jgi:hypothetical protein